MVGGQGEEGERNDLTNGKNCGVSNPQPINLKKLGLLAISVLSHLCFS